VTELRLREAAAIDALLVRGIETEDADGLVLTREDRRYATGAALAATPIGDPPSPRDTAAFVTRRSALALERLLARYPTLQRVRALSRWPGWLSWALPFGAFAIGVATDALDGERLNILAFPLLALIAWNLVTYLVLLVQALSRRLQRRPPSHPLRRWLEWLVRPASARLAGQPTLERGVQRYARDWSHAAARLTRSRAARTLHLGAAMFALGVLAGMLLRARYAGSYTAGWSGTWAGAETEIAALLKVVLGPASLLTSKALPSVERIRELRGGGENAGDWLVLWTVTAALFVVIPRLVLAALAGAQATLLAQRLPLADDFYLRSLLRNALGRPGVARVVPYSFDLPPDGRERLTRLVQSATGDKTRVTVDPAVAYGAEDEWLTRDGASLGAADHLILLFNLASTPEAENHGALVAGVRQRIGAGATALLALLDDSSFRHKLRGQGSTDRRIADRMDAWRAVLAPAAVTPVAVTLDAGDEAAGARNLEQALLRSGAA
jgi:hypothetical protein